MFKDVIWSFKKFGGQTTKNVQGIWNIALKTLKCVMMRTSLLEWVTCIFFESSSCGRSTTFLGFYSHWKRLGTTSKGPRERSHNKDPRRVKIPPRQCQSTNQTTPSSLTNGRWWSIFDGNIDWLGLKPKIGEGPIEGSQRTTTRLTNGQSIGSVDSGV